MKRFSVLVREFGSKREVESIISDREIMGVADDELPPWEESPP
jgi:hypothetical protein